MRACSQTHTHTWHWLCTIYLLRSHTHSIGVKCWMESSYFDADKIAVWLVWFVVCRIYGFYMNGGYSKCATQRTTARIHKSNEASFKNYYLYRSIFVFLSQHFFGMRVGVLGFTESCPRTFTHAHTVFHPLISLSLVFNLCSFFGSFLSSLYIFVAALSFFLVSLRI